MEPPYPTGSDGIIGFGLKDPAGFLRAPATQPLLITAEKSWSPSPHEVDGREAQGMHNGFYSEDLQYLGQTSVLDSQINERFNKAREDEIARTLGFDRREVPLF